MEYMKLHDFETRKSDSTRIMKKYPNRIPIICENIDNITPKMKRCKFLVPKELSVADFMYVIRKRIKISETKAIYLFVNNNTLVPTSHIINQVYSDHHNEDGFLYITYGFESTFG